MRRFFTCAPTLAEDPTDQLGPTSALPEYVPPIARPMLRHHLPANFNAEADQVTIAALIDNLIQVIPVNGTTPRERKQVNEALR